METELPTVSYELIQQLGIGVLAAVVIFFVGRYIARFVTRMAKRGMAKAHVEDTLERFLGNLLYAVLMTGFSTTPNRRSRSTNSAITASISSSDPG